VPGIPAGRQRCGYTAAPHRRHRPRAARLADDVLRRLLLQDQQQKSEQGDAQMLEGLHFTKELGYEIKSVLEAGKIYCFGELMHQHWLRKRKRSAGMSNNRIDDLYDLARNRGGATGGKLVGAGGSGFLLFHTHDRRRLRSAMTEAGVYEMDFAFDFDGSMVVMRS
jgi:D-glycero-alpha-D-manno-heptose-7-phosphate kinase